MGRLTNLTVELVPSTDDRYGSVGPAGLWSGLVGMLLRSEVDCVAADLTVTAARLAVMDFSQPFLSSSITLLLRVSLSLLYCTKLVL